MYGVEEVPMLTRRLVYISLSPKLSSASALDEETADQSGSKGNPANDGNSDQTLFRDLVVDQLAQAGGLQVSGLVVEQEIVIPTGFGVVAQLEVSESEVVKAFPASFGSAAEDF